MLRNWTTLVNTFENVSGRENQKFMFTEKIFCHGLHWNHVSHSDGKRKYKVHNSIISPPPVLMLRCNLEWKSERRQDILPVLEWRERGDKMFTCFRMKREETRYFTHFRLKREETKCLHVLEWKERRQDILPILEWRERRQDVYLF